MYDSIEIVDHGIQVTRAPDYAVISLQALVSADPRVMFAVGGSLFVGDHLYEVIEWDTLSASLRLRRRDTLRDT